MNITSLFKQSSSAKNSGQNRHSPLIDLRQVTKVYQTRRVSHTVIICSSPSSARACFSGWESCW